LDIVPFAATACENDIDLELDEVGIDLAAVTPIQEPVGSFAACCACAAKRPWGPPRRPGDSPQARTRNIRSGRRSLEPRRCELHHAAGVGLNGKLYQVHECDPASDHWPPRGPLAAAVLDVKDPRGWRHRLARPTSVVGSRESLTKNCAGLSRLCAAVDGVSQPAPGNL